MAFIPTETRAATLEPLSATIAERITATERAFAVQDYPRVIVLADGLMGHPDLAGRSEHVKLLEWLGSAHWFSGARDASRLVFGALLRESPFHRLDEFIYPQELIDFFEERRAELVNARIIPSRPDEPLPDQVGPQRILTRNFHLPTTPVVAYLAPFGVGQFANDEPGKGALMAVLQGIGAATMAATWLGIEALKTPGSNQISREDGGSARLLNGLWYAGFSLFTATWAYSIIDGLVVRETEPTVEERFEFIDPAELPPTTRLVPGPGGFGLGLDVRW